RVVRKMCEKIKRRVSNDGDSDVACLLPSGVRRRDLRNETIGEDHQRRDPSEAVTRTERCWGQRGGSRSLPIFGDAPVPVFEWDRANDASAGCGRGESRNPQRDEGRQNDEGEPHSLSTKHLPCHDNSLKL